MSGFDLVHNRVAKESPCLVVAEVAQAHEGSLGMAHAYINAVSRAGADAVKFQCHLAEAESTKDERWRVAPTWPQDDSRYEYWQRTGFNAEQWQELKQHADHMGLDFLCSPFSVEAVELLEPLVPAWKIPSGELLNEPMLEAVTKTDKPVILSTGMSTEEEFRSAVGKWGWREWAVMQCTSMYPTPADKVGLANIQVLQSEFPEVPVGFSDHSGTVYAGLGAVAVGIEALEVHVCFHKEQFGFDVAASLTMEELKDLVRGVLFLEQARELVYKDELAAGELEATRDLFMDKWRKKQ